MNGLGGEDLQKKAKVLGARALVTAFVQVGREIGCVRLEGASLTKR